MSVSVKIVDQYKTPELQDFLSDPDRFLATTSGPFFKSEEGDTTTIAVVSIDQQPYVVKRYNFRNAYHAIKCFLRPSRARRSWHNAFLLKKLNIPTIEPVALLEQRVGPLFGKSYFVSKYADGVRGCDYFAKDSPYQDHWPQAVAAVTTLIAQLKSAHIYHPDLQFGNIVMLDHQPVLLDLDYMRQFKKNGPRFEKAFARSIQHFLKFVSVSPEAFHLFETSIGRSLEK